jgi:hypothetical protein
MMMMMMMDGDFKGCSHGLFLYQYLPGQAKEKEYSC